MKRQTRNANPSKGYAAIVWGLALAIGAIALASAVWAKDEPRPASPSSAAATVPVGVPGRWVATRSSATTYWNRDNGQYLGDGSGNAQLYEFDDHGGFTYYLTMEIRTGSLVSRVRNNCKGTVSFNGDRFTLHPASGHYHTEFGSRVTDREMTTDDLSRLAKTYHWRLEKGADGKPRFIVPFPDNSKLEFRVLPEVNGSNK